MDWKHIRLIKPILQVSFSEFICFLYWLYLEEYMRSRKTCLLLHLGSAKTVFLISVASLTAFQVGLNYTGKFYCSL